MNKTLIICLIAIVIVLLIFNQINSVPIDIVDRYRKEMQRDLNVDLNFYRYVNGISDERLRLIKETEFILEGSIKDNSIKYSSYEKYTSNHYIFAGDPTEKEIIITTPISETTIKTTINLWWLRNSAPSGVLPGIITFFPDRTEMVTFERKNEINDSMGNIDR